MTEAAAQWQLAHRASLYGTDLPSSIKELFCVSFPPQGANLCCNLHRLRFRRCATQVESRQIIATCPLRGCWTPCPAETLRRRGSNSSRDDRFYAANSPDSVGQLLPVPRTR